MDVPDLLRLDLLQVNPIRNTNTVKLLPVGKKGKQKLIVGDDDGYVTCYEFIKGEPSRVFQIRPFTGPISCVSTGNSINKRENIFISHGQQVIGITKKGKKFFEMVSSVTETIRHIAVEDTRLWAGCEYVYSIYDNGKDSGLYMCRDQINSLMVDHVIRNNDFDAVLSCQDSCIRVMVGADAALTIPTVSAVTCTTMIKAVGSSSNSIKWLVCGMENGAMSMFRISATGEVETRWTLEDSKRVSISCILAASVIKGSASQIVVGREDGRLEVYTTVVNRSEISNKYMHFTLGFVKDIGESIRSLDCGYVNSIDYPEIIVGSYSGKVLSFTSENINQRAQDDTYGRSIKTVNDENRLRFLKKEVEELKKKIEKEKEKYKKIAPSAIKSLATTGVSPQACDFPINVKFILDNTRACYVLTIEIQSAMDLIIVRSPVVLELIESEVGSSVPSITPPHLVELSTSNSSEMRHKFLAAFRCQGQERRATMCLRSTEGEYGDLLITVVTAADSKAAKVIQFPLKPLSLHYRVHSLSVEESKRPLNTIKFTGALSMSLLHDWVQNILPDIPPRLNEEQDVCCKYFCKNSFSDAVTTVEYSKNSLIVCSECASTIVIFKENVTRLANFRRIQVEEAVTTNDDSITSIFELLRSKLDYQLSLSRKFELLDSLQEITMQEDNISWLPAEYADILQNQESIRREFKLREKALGYLSGMLTDLYVDWGRLKGNVDNRKHLQQMQNAILSGNYELMIQMFFPVSQRK